MVGIVEVCLVILTAISVINFAMDYFVGENPES